jgi:ferritin
MNNQMMNMLNQLRQNPMQILSKRFNLPQEMANNPQEIIQHLLNTGQISQGQVNNAMQMKKQFLGN